MKASELRIGNYILDYEADADESIYWQVEEIQRLSEDKALNQTVGVTYRRGSCWSCDIEPIPLTEEWLLKFGFENERDEYWIIENEYLNFLMFVNSRSKKMYHFEDCERRQYHSTKEIKYVHQLQNLYFALTGEELIIK